MYSSQKKNFFFEGKKLAPILKLFLFYYGLTSDIFNNCLIFYFFIYFLIAKDDGRIAIKLETSGYSTCMTRKKKKKTEFICVRKSSTPTPCNPVQLCL